MAIFVYNVHNITMAVTQEIVNTDSSYLSYLLLNLGKATLNRIRPMHLFSSKGHGLGHVTPKIFGIRSNV